MFILRSYQLIATAYSQPRDPKFVAVVEWWSLFTGKYMLYRLKLGLQNGGRFRQVVVHSGLTLHGK
jgi:hypothetical protein